MILGIFGPGRVQSGLTWVQFREHKVILVLKVSKAFLVFLVHKVCKALKVR
jgi:hypothetical protein